MLLESVEIQRFRNFTRAQRMIVEPSVTCLVGKNESGKTTILQAMHRLNPANQPDRFDIAIEYPRRGLARDRRNGNIADINPVTAWFCLEPADIAEVTHILGTDPPPATRIKAARSYANKLTVEVECGLTDVIRALGRAAEVDSADLEYLSTLPDLSAVTRECRDLAARLQTHGHTARAAAVTAMAEQAPKYLVLVGERMTVDQEQALIDLLPKFFYFSTYALLSGEVDLNELIERCEANQLRSGDETMLALLSLAAHKPKDFLDEQYISRKAELQAASADLTAQVMKYWKQNSALSVRFDTDMPIVGHNPDGSPLRHRILKVELYDARHEVETSFSTRSYGFQWFFSFLAAFHTYMSSPDRVVVLLDEPATSLHGEAQRDFLAYIFHELGNKQQVLYTTHSLHMINTSRYESLRAVHDQATRENPELGVAVTSIDLCSDWHTALPVEAALGYAVSQQMFLNPGPHVAVEDNSDLVLLKQMSRCLARIGRVALDPQISIIPVGPVANIAAFIALLGRRLDIRAVVDGPHTATAAPQVRAAAEAAGMPLSKVVTIDDLAGVPDNADIEDLFTPKDYLWLYIRCGNRLATAINLPGPGQPILQRISSEHGEFDPMGPAHRLAEHLDEFSAQVDQETLDRFETLYRLLNT